ncbi:MAG: hypothetical protein QOD32_320 [Pyrinomonadaceae bacterium]|jgi:uncharacterized iron-regulated membrane protein|nr:hypothetical protein [Pyrinomonadaceae bacterium]
MKTRTLIFRLHLIAGLTVGLLLVVSGLTGSLLVFDDAIDKALNSSLLRVAPAATVERISPAAAVEAVRRSLPPQEQVARVRLPRESDGVYEVCLRAKGDPRCLYVDPYTARVLGERVPAESFKGRVFALHRRLFSGETGETIIGVGGLALVLLSISGLYLWWPGRKRLRRGFRINFSARGRRLQFDLHRVIGICAMAFLLLIGLTGAGMAFNPTSERFLNRVTASPPRPPQPTFVARPGVQPAALELVLERADEALPGAETVLVNLPQTPTAPFVVRKRLPGEWHPNGRSAVYLDQYSGAPLQVQNALAAPAGTRLANLLYPLHTGRLAGTPTRVVHVLVGLAPLFLFSTGLLMWRARRVVARRARPVESGISPQARTETVGG